MKSEPVEQKNLTHSDDEDHEEIIDDNDLEDGN